MNLKKLWKVMNGFVVIGGKSDYQRFVKGEITTATFPHYGDWGRARRV